MILGNRPWLVLHGVQPLRPLPENVSDAVIAKAKAKDEALRAAK